MVVSYLETVILYSLNQINNERSIYSVFHLLKGKKSSQTIQDAHLFHLEKLFQILPTITRTDFEDRLNQCDQYNWLRKMDEQHFLVTEEGKMVLSQQMEEKPLPKYLNGWNFHSLTSVFWERLSLLVQVCSNLIHHRSEYYPIQRKQEIQSWLKSFLYQSTNDRKMLSRQLYDEIITVFEFDSSIDPTYLIIRLTGHDKFGLTSQQASQFFNLDPFYYHLQFLNILHFMIETIHQNPVQFPLLSRILQDLNAPASFTVSTSKTYMWLKKGLNIDEIATIRNLKRSTVEDHLVEIALIDKNFDISYFVSNEKQRLILAASKQSHSKQLKYIRELAKDVDYFEIRLVLAKFGD